MERSEALKPLSREHHQALFMAKRLREEQGPGILAELEAFWRTEGELHFRIEEEILLPGSGLPGAEQDEDVARILEDHRRIREQVDYVLDGGASFDDQRALGTALTEHVRFEEQELFPRIEASLTPDELDRLGSEVEAAEA